jgi:uncharacterized membrane-anchored protein
MDRPTGSSRKEQFELERKLLTALCQPAFDAQIRAKVLQRLKAHAFVEPDHEVIYRALAVMPEAESGEIREWLARAVTRLGYPDVDFDALFSAAPPASAEVAALLERL